MTKQKRSHARIQWNFPCRFKTAKIGASEEIQGWGIIRNISVRGAELATRFPIKEKNIIFLSFRIGLNDQFTNLPASVVRFRMGGGYRICGLLFDEKADRGNIENAIANLLTQQ